MQPSSDDKNGVSPDEGRPGFFPGNIVKAGNDGEPRPSSAVPDEIRAVVRRERYLAAIFSGLPFPLSLQTPDSRYLLANTPFCEILNKKREDIIGKTEKEVIPAEFLAESSRRFVEAIRTGTSPASEENTLLGTLALERYALKNQQGKVVAVLSYGLSPAKSRDTGWVMTVLEELVGASPAPKALYDASGTLIIAHPEFKAGSSPQKGRTGLQRTLPQSWLSALEAPDKMGRGEVFSRTGEYQTDYPSTLASPEAGEKIAVIPVRDPGSKKTVGYLAEPPPDTRPDTSSIADIILGRPGDSGGPGTHPAPGTEISAGIPRYRAVLESHPGIVCILDPEGRIIEFSGGIMAPVLLGRQNLENTFIVDLVTPPSRVVFAGLLDRVRNGSPRVEENIVFGGSGEERVFRVICSPSGEEEIVCSLLDLTHEREVESQAIKCHDLLSLDMSAWISEALRDTARVYQRLPPEMKEQARQMIGHIRRCVDVTRAFSATEKISARPSGLRSLPLDRLIRSEVMNYPDLSIHYRGTKAIVVADDTLSDVLWFLLGNIARHAGRNAVVLIEVLETGNIIELRMTDTGSGIPPEVRASVFSQRSTSEVHGLLRGLALSKALVERLGGVIKVRERAPGTPSPGTVVSIHLKAGQGPVRSFTL